MLKEIIQEAQLTPEFLAKIAKVPLEDFSGWLDGRAPVPHYIIAELSAVVGVSSEEISNRRRSRPSDSGGLAPAIWYKLRQAQLGDVERETVGLIRRLGFSMLQLDQATGDQSTKRWDSIAVQIRKEVDRSAPPARQGATAAALFRTLTNIDHGKEGVGEIIRPLLRRFGVVLLESPVSKSALEGCCFEVGLGENLRTAIFVNSFKSTWFRRNEVMMHEVCHAIFDLDHDAISLDFDVNKTDNLAEVRANAFARECLVPSTVLSHYENQFGIKWEALTAEQMAKLIANIHVEQRTILKAAVNLGFLTQTQADEYATLECWSLLRDQSVHALRTHDYLKHLRETKGDSVEGLKWLGQYRNTSIGGRRLRLPAGLVQRVIEAVNNLQISPSKGAELLLMEKQTFLERFGALIQEPDLR